MRIAQKKEILECLKSLRQALEEIDRALCSRDYDLIRNMLAECQEFAVSLGESIERFEGQGHITVAYLEDYCELLFRIYEEVGRQTAEKHEVREKLQNKLSQIESSVKNDIRVKKEVVFLPYKASMWDSMESVWMKEDKEDMNETFVVPIPYFERNGDGSLGCMHYEGGEYPDYVPVTDWQQYEMDKRKPDVVYIQNPYDDCNYVTCVHPQYFSRELKKNAEMLIYLPYFVGIDNHVAEHFCTSPGVMNADRIFVQSKEVKKIYIENIRKFERQNKCKGLFGNLDEKIQLLENPKIDRLKRVMASGAVDIPEEWKAKIYRENGERKKVFLYNTTIDTLLKHSDTYMRKLKSVLETFQQEQEVVLLWRPHPLLVATIKSMRPDLYREYMEIVKDYQEQDWGIYDGTADIDRAIVLSDAYYGDMSSVVELYKVTGKPIMIQNCEIG